MYKQEPLAWMWTVNNGAGYSSRGIGFEQTDIPFAKHIPLYTAPPQRDVASAKAAEWQGLTDEDIDDVQYNVDCRLYRDYARAIEAKLKEKNHA